MNDLKCTPIPIIVNSAQLIIGQSGRKNGVSRSAKILKNSSIAAYDLYERTARCKFIGQVDFSSRLGMICTLTDGARKFRLWRYYRPTWPHLEGPSRLKSTYSTRLAGLWAKWSIPVDWHCGRLICVHAWELEVGAERRLKNTTTACPRHLSLNTLHRPIISMSLHSLSKYVLLLLSWVFFFKIIHLVKTVL